MRVLAAPDKFKGTATAHEVAQAIGHACSELDIECVELPMADGGDGILDVLGGPNRTSTVTGPLGNPIEAAWRFHKETAVIEMARASGLVLAGGATGNDALDATSTGTGELIDKALDLGAKRIVVGLGGSASTDGGFGAIRAISAISRLKQVDLLIACDVQTTFTDAAVVFGPQKGASPAQVKMLTRRLERLAQMFVENFAFDVTVIEGGGAAGGLGGALAAIGGRLVPGFELVADELNLYDVLPTVDLVITGEGQLDETSFAGKVVGGITQLSSEYAIPVAAIVGVADPAVVLEWADRITIDSLVDRFGEDVALNQTKKSIQRAATLLLRSRLDQ
jgi:glycerate kinase